MKVKQEDIPTYEQFIQWLSNHRLPNLHEQYQTNIANQEDDYLNSDTVVDPINFVDAFTWRDTPEGYKYWLQINAEWINYLWELENA